MRFAIALTLILILLTGCSALGPQTAPTALPTNPPATDVVSSPPTETPPVGEPTQEPSVQEPTQPTTEPQTAGAWLAYLGMDGNVWMVERASGERKAVTQDAVDLPTADQQNIPAVLYSNPQWSSDGRMLAYVREVAIPLASGFDSQVGLWVYDFNSGQAREVIVEEIVAGYAWRPGTSVIAYAPAINQEYFFTSDPSLATGIRAVDVDSGEAYELVPPSSGYPLVQPKWSDNGRFLGFDEIFAMEGRGRFAYYDFETQEYIAWQEVIGSYSWSPDGSMIAYDRLAYVPSGAERIWVRERQGGQEIALSPEGDPGSYAYNPRFSPDGSQVAYFAAPDAMGSGLVQLMLVSVEGGAPRNLGTFDQPIEFIWAADGQGVLITNGPYDQRHIVEINLADGAHAVLADGNSPAWQPAAP